MGLFKNLKLLVSDSVLARMSELETRQDLLEEYTQARLDSVKAYSARVAKRERDERARTPRTNDQEDTHAPGPVAYANPRVAALAARRARRVGSHRMENGASLG